MKDPDYPALLLAITIQTGTIIGTTTFAKHCAHDNEGGSSTLWMKLTGLSMVEDIQRQPLLIEIKQMGNPLVTDI